MLFVVNIGNTNIACGLHNAGTWTELWRFSTEERKTADEYTLLIKSAFDLRSSDINAVDRVIISTVVPELEQTFITAGRKLFGRDPFIVKPWHTAGLTVAIDNPRELGTDLLADAVAGYKLAKSSCIIADFGTALSFTAVEAGGIIRGAALAPGIGSAIRALSANTAKLPRVPLEAPSVAIGTDTISAIQSGIIHGYTGLVEHLVRMLGRELTAPVKIIATGGDSRVIADRTGCFDLVDPWLTLDGIRLICEAEEDKAGAP
jgi:type III pantothenate kinase